MWSRRFLLFLLCPFLQRCSSFAFPETSSSGPLSIGFIGCGTIAKAIATGLATQQTIPLASISVSRRSASKSEALQKSFPGLVSIYDENQEVVDKSCIVFVAVLPEHASCVLRELKFLKDRHSLVSLVSTSRLPDLIHDSDLPAHKVYKMICLPSVARHEGISLIVPKCRTQPVLKEMLISLGGCVECEDETKMNAMMVPSGLMGPMYGILRKSRDWLVNKGISKGDASYYVGRMYWGMLQDAERVCRNPDGFDELIEEQTPGGLNEQALKDLDEMGLFEIYDKTMDALLSRLHSKSDGPISDP